MWSSPGSTAYLYVLIVLGVGVQLAAAAGGSCDQNNLTTSYVAPKAGNGWTYRLVASGLAKPRSLIFDGEGALLVLDADKGIERLTFDDYGGTCLAVNERQTVLSNEELNHGIALSRDNGTLYASTANDVFAWTYDAKAGTVATPPRTVVTGMANAMHQTRTLMTTTTGQLLVSRGSAANADAQAWNQTSGHCQIRLFPTDQQDALDYASTGSLVGWGLRNSVGVTQHPVTGGIWSVENSVDNVMRQQVDIHNDNPAEELNYHGTPAELRGAHHGYPGCYTLWGTSGVPGLADGMTTGSQFTVDSSEGASLNGTAPTDQQCNANFAAPEIAFQAHTAPLDIKFDTAGTTAFVSFHGSWNRESPVGYAVGTVAFNSTSGRPTAERNSTTAVTEIMWNADLSACPGGCFRPVGLAWDHAGRLFVASDSTGELFVLVREEDDNRHPAGAAPRSASVDVRMLLGLVAPFVGILL